jgi:hypothetical protein
MTDKIVPVFQGGDLVPSSFAFSFPPQPADFLSQRSWEYCCEVPAGLGEPIGLEIKGGKLVCHTTSGIDMIVSRPRSKSDD